MEDISIYLLVFVSQNLFYKGKMKNHLFEFNLHCGFQESKRSISNSSTSMSDVPIQAQILTTAYEEETKGPYRYLFLDFHPNSSEFVRVRRNIFPLEVSISQKISKSKRILQSHLVYKRTCVSNQIFICVWFE